MAKSFNQEEKKMGMFCDQCEQTFRGVGCTDVGCVGKTRTWSRCKRFCSMG
jgi:hydroxylamine reductase (hybrid-cluster protein)